MADRVTLAARRLRALQLRRSGLTYSEIARQLDLKSPQLAAHDVSVALAEKQKLDDLVTSGALAMELDKLDNMERHVNAILQNAAGGGDPRLADPGVVLGSVDRLLKIGERRQALQPAEVPVPEDDVVDHIKKAARAKLRVVPDP